MNLLDAKLFRNSCFRFRLNNLYMYLPFYKDSGFIISIIVPDNNLSMSGGSEQTHSYKKIKGMKYVYKKK